MQLFDSSSSIRREIRHSLGLDLNEVDRSTGGKNGQDDLDGEQPPNEGICYLLNLRNFELTIAFTVHQSVLLHLRLATSVDNYSIHPVSRFQRSAS